MHNTEFATLVYRFRTFPSHQARQAQSLSDPQMRRLFEGFDAVGEQMVKDQQRELRALNDGIWKMDRVIVQMRHSNSSNANYSGPQGQ